jgi:predicted TPR repeat methyltransferase
MDHLAIASAYNEIAERWLNERFDQSNGVGQHERALSFLQDRTGGWALNVGCGCNTRFNASMRGYGMNIEGIDIASGMVSLARQADPTVIVHHADVCNWQIRRAYRFISAWDSIWHVRLEHQRSLMLKLMGALEAGGIFIFTAGGLDAEDEHIDAAMGPGVYYATLGIPGLLDVIKDAGCVCRHLEFDQYPQKHLYIVAQRVEN